ncbi:glycoside hydrolase, partial [Ampelomyces quisqualis]
NEWVVTRVMPARNAGVEYTIPACLKPGYFFVRHEMIALHSTYSEGSAQSYPGCHQLKLSGEGTKVPSDLVSFPRMYDGKDSGLVLSIDNQWLCKIPEPEALRYRR